MVEWKIKIGLTYKVTFDDCCVRGNFTSKLTESQDENDNGELHDTDKLEYGVELKFENGVNLTAWNAVVLELVK